MPSREPEAPFTEANNFVRQMVRALRSKPKTQEKSMMVQRSVAGRSHAEIRVITFRICRWDFEHNPGSLADMGAEVIDSVDCLKGLRNIQGVFTLKKTQLSITQQHSKYGQNKYDRCWFCSRSGLKMSKSF
jgi:hypothetical protein